MSLARSAGHFSHMAAGPSTIVLFLGGPIARSDLPRLCAHARILLTTSGADVLVCDASRLASARRLGSRICVRHAPAELEQLLRLAGLAEICGLVAVLEREPEQGEDPLGVQEEGELGDPPS